MRNKYTAASSESALARQFSSQEQSFFTLLFLDACTVIRINQEVCDVFQKHMENLFPRVKREDLNLLLGGIYPFLKQKQGNLFHLVVEFILLSHRLMFSFDIKTNVKIVSKRNHMLLSFCKLIYKHTFTTEFSDDFEDYLCECFYESTLVNFNPEKMFQLFRQEEFNGYLIAKRSIEDVRAICQNLEMFYEKTCTVFAFISYQQIRVGLHKLQAFHKKLIEEYSSSTQSTPVYQIVKILGLVSFCMICGAENFRLYFSVLFGLLALLFQTSFVHQRVLNPEFQALYACQFDMITKVKAADSISLYEKALQYAKAQRKAVREGLRFVELTPEPQSLPPLRKVDKHKTEQQKPVFILHYAIEEENFSSPYNTNNIRKYYPFEKKARVASSIPKPALFLEPVVPEYALPRELQGQGCLVQGRNGSCVFFDFGNLIDIINPKVKKNILANQYPFGKAKGQFNVFKETQKGQYRLKLFDGYRIDYHRKGDVCIPNKAGSVPRFVAVQAG